jgi:hypothetical protein
VLQKAIQEINDITDITVTTENIRKGRSVESIRFTVHEKTHHILSQEETASLGHVEEQVDEGQVTLDAVFSDTYVDPNDPDDELALIASALPSNFTREQVELLRLLSLNHMPLTIGSVAERDMWIFDFLHRKLKLMEATPGVVSPFAWLRKAVAEDWN